MKVRPFASPAVVVLVLLVSGAGLGACGGDSEPQDRRFDLTIADGKLGLDPPVVTVNDGDDVTLRVDADEHGTFHLHGYDIEINVSPDETATMRFKADATGQFKITFHREEEGHEESGEGDEHQDEEEAAIASLEVRPR